MKAIKAHFDGEKVVIPEELRSAPPGDVILIFDNLDEKTVDFDGWMKAQESAFAKVWNNDEDAVYDTI